MIQIHKPKDLKKVNGLLSWSNLTYPTALQKVKKIKNKKNAKYEYINIMPTGVIMPTSLPSKGILVLFLALQNWF